MKEDKAVEKIMGILSDKKKCSGCGEEKSIDEYYKDKDKKDGLKSMCKKCIALCDKEKNKKKKQRLYAKKESHKITLDFSSIKGGLNLLEEFKKEAELNLRTIENEIFFFLKGK